MPFHHQIRVRYSETDQQGVVFNANYMVYMDDAADVWMRSLAADRSQEELDWEWMLVRAALEWKSPARNGDLLDVQVGIARWGRTSFDLGFIGRVEDRDIFRARSVCVSINPKTLTKIETPAAIQELAGPPVEWDIPS